MNSKGKDTESTEIWVGDSIIWIMSLEFYPNSISSNVEVKGFVLWVVHLIITFSQSEYLSPERIASFIVSPI